MLIDGGVVHVNVSLDPAKMGLTTEAIIGQKLILTKWIQCVLV